MVASRPATLNGVVGLRKAREQITDLADAAMARHEMPGDVFITGPGGTGKTTLALTLAARLGVPLRVTMSTAVRTIPNMLKVLQEIAISGRPIVWFLDEVHKVLPATLLLLYSAIEDRVFSVPGEPEPVKLPPLTFIAATTDPDQFDESFCGRFAVRPSTTYYSHDELAEIVTRAAERGLYAIGPDAAMDIARRARGVPREALRLMDRSRDKAQKAGNTEEITPAHVVAAMRVEDIDTLGLSDLDRRVLEAIGVHFMGMAIGIDAIVTYVGDKNAKKSITYLQRIGLVRQTKPGQVATKAGYMHLKALKELEEASVPVWRGSDDTDD